MHNTRLCLPTARTITGWLCVSAMLMLVVPALAQISAAKPPPTDAAHVSSTPPTSGNTYQAGGDVRLVTPINGNVYAAGGRVTLEQPVSGLASLAGGAISVRAPVGSDLRAAGGEINIESVVGGQLYASGGNIILSNAAVVAKAATLYGGKVTIEGKVNGPLKVYAQKIVLNGEVAGNVELNGEEIDLGSRAKVGGALRYSGNALFKTAQGVAIGGAVTQGNAMNGRPDTHRDRQWHGQMMGSSAGWAGSVAGFIAILATSLLFLLVFTGFSQRAANRVWGAPWPALASGIAVLLGTPLAATLLFVTLIGIPLGLALLLLLPLALLLGGVVGVFSLSHRFQQAVQKPAPGQSRAAMIGFFALTLLLVLLVSSLPFVGGLVLFAVILLGTGACAIELYHQLGFGRTPQAPGKALASAAS